MTHRITRGAIAAVTVVATGLALAACTPSSDDNGQLVAFCLLYTSPSPRD